jgi:DNA-binding MarR family transcriptional regulator
MKTTKQLERYFKGVANYHRLDILLLVFQESGISLEEIADRLNANFKTISEHTKKLVQAGLLNKKHSGRSVGHFLSPYGERFVKYIKTFE